MVQHDKAEFLICTLEHSHLYNQVLDLNFTEGEEVTFFLNGQGRFFLILYDCQWCDLGTVKDFHLAFAGTVHLTGYLHDEEEEPGATDSEEESEDSDYGTLL